MLCPKCGAHLTEVIGGYMCYECGGGMFSEDEVITVKCPYCNEELVEMDDTFYCYSCSRQINRWILSK